MHEYWLQSSGGEHPQRATLDNPTYRLSTGNNHIMSRYLVFLLGGLWGCFLSSLVQDTVLWTTIGFMCGVLGAAFAFAICESMILLDSDPHEKYDEKYPKTNHD